MLGNQSSNRMPVVFAGHGSPMNAIEENEFTRGWERIAQELPRPKAILAVSAHWYTHGTKVADSEQPKMIYDMYGFPEALYQVKYPVKGDPQLAHLVQSLLGETSEIDNTWGLDHGVWSILHKMYPKADIPVVELSVNSDANARAHFQLGQKLKPLRDKGIMIFASGNVVHNLSYVDFAMEKAGYPFAEEFDRYIKEKIMNRNFEDVINYQLAGDCSSLAVQTPEHFYPLLYAIGASDASDSLSIYNDACTLGALSMTSYLFQ